MANMQEIIIDFMKMSRKIKNPLTSINIYPYIFLAIDFKGKMVVDFEVVTCRDATGIPKAAATLYKRVKDRSIHINVTKSKIERIFHRLSSDLINSKSSRADEVTSLLKESQTFQDEDV